MDVTVLRYLVSVYPAWVSASDVAKALGISVTSARRKIAALERRGLLETAKLHVTTKPMIVYRIKLTSLCRDEEIARQLRQEISKVCR